MNKVIVYNDADGVLCFLTPLCDFDINLIAKKDVPKGLSYKIIDSSDLPEDRTFRSAWEIDNSLLTDGVGADFGVGSDNAVIAYTEKSVIIAPAINNVVDYTKQNEVNV